MRDEWRVRLVCCGRDDGVVTFLSWEEADAFRDAYVQGAGVAEHGYSAAHHEPGHRRAGIIERQGRARNPGVGAESNKRGLPYPWCPQPEVCRGRGSCPRDPNCGE